MHSARHSWATWAIQATRSAERILERVDRESDQMKVSELAKIYYTSSTNQVAAKQRWSQGGFSQPSEFGELSVYPILKLTKLSDAESAHLKAFLAQHFEKPELAVRWGWREGDLAIWDERCTLHRALGDHYPPRRVVRRCTVDAESPPTA